MRCKTCKEKFLPKYAFQKYCMEKDECIKAFAVMVKAHSEKKERKKTIEKSKTVKPEKWQKRLGDSINELARKIDSMFGITTCIDCDNPFNDSIHAAHFHSKGSNNSLRYNLHNLHSARGYCNQYSNQHISGYEKGLEKRYGYAYAQMVIKEIPYTYQYIKVTGLEASEKLPIVNKLIKNLHTFKFKDAIEAREQLNKIIGIYI